VATRGAEAPILILQHIACEPPGAYQDELLERGLPFRRVRLDEGDELPDLRELAGIVAMGGPMGVYDHESHRWLDGEKRFIASAVRAGTPYWGVCLGAQLLAASLGARVTPGTLPEVGVDRVQLTRSAASDPVFSCAPAVFDALHWHGDTYRLPAGATRLAFSAQYEQQAFVFDRAYALQFHLEVTPALARDWIEVPAYVESLERVMGPAAGARLLEQLARTSASAIPLARELFGRWLDRVVDTRAPSSADGRGRW
jgi:GMP synthase-like glutamine amidotransferase